MFARTRAPERRIPSRTNGCAERCSMTTNSASSAAVTTKPPTMDADPQPDVGAVTTVRTSRSMAALTVSAPGTSYCERPPDTPRSVGIARRPRITSATASGAGTRKVQRQPSSVSSPPSTSPNEKPLAPTVVKMLRARFRAGPSGNVVVMIDNAAGAVNAALAPLMKRAAISSEPSLTRPPRADATVNTLSAIKRVRRRPRRSAARPPRRRNPP